MQTNTSTLEDVKTIKRKLFKKLLIATENFDDKKAKELSKRVQNLNTVIHILESLQVTKKCGIQSLVLSNLNLSKDERLNIFNYN